MIGQRKNPSTPSTAPRETTTGGQNCPNCQTYIPAEGCWCPGCGLMAADPCWDCGKPLAEGARFCAYCGTPNTEPAVLQCAACQATVGRGQGWCTNCGEQVRTVCRSCDRILRHDWQHCPHCGGEPVTAAPGAALSAQRNVAAVEEEEATPWTQAAPSHAQAEKLNQQGVRAYESERYDEAVRYFQQATEANPSNASYFVNLGVALGELGQDLQALETYRKALAVNPREAGAYLNLGYLYSHMERVAEAREMWEKVIEVAPESAEAEEARENLRNFHSV